MKKVQMKPGNMVYPVPAALVSCADKNRNSNLITVAWTGTICSDPPMLYISVRPERHSYQIIKESGVFVLNLTTKEMIEKVDLCGVISGKNENKWERSGFTPLMGNVVDAPLVKESPVNIECKVTEIKKLGTHDMFIAEVVAVDVDENLISGNGKLDLNKAGLVAYSHGEYLELGDTIGTFGYSVRKKPDTKTEKVEAKENSDKKEKIETCAIARKCGGCQYTGTSYDSQLKKKQNYIEGLIGQYGKVNLIIGMDNPYNYRNKVHHVFAYDKKKGVISGCYEEKTHNVVDVENCLIEDKLSQDIIRTIRKLCKSFKIKTFDEDTGYGLLRHVLIRRGFTSGEVMVVLVLSSQVLPGKNDFIKALRTAHPEITTIVLNVNNKSTSMVLGDFEKPIYGPGFIKDTLCGCTFRISPKSFYQINPVQTEKLYKTAIDFAALTGNETVIDAYCGIGTIGICAAKKAGNVIGIELNADAVRDAIINAKENNLKNITFIKGDAGDQMDAMAAAGQKADVVFMDPPRTGSTEKFMKSAMNMKPDRIVYVSCGPDTLARDLEYLARGGYKVKKMQPVDMFPFTKHVETVALLSKAAK